MLLLLSDLCEHSNINNTANYLSEAYLFQNKYWKARLEYFWRDFITITFKSEVSHAALGWKLKVQGNSHWLHPLLVFHEMTISRLLSCWRRDCKVPPVHPDADSSVACFQVCSYDASCVLSRTWVSPEPFYSFPLKASWSGGPPSHAHCPSMTAHKGAGTQGTLHHPFISTVMLSLLHHWSIRFLPKI